MHFSLTETGSNMASAEKRPAELLSCGICTESYDDDQHKAKFLKCYHTFCSHCLTQWYRKKAPPYKNYVQCPSCSKSTGLPKDGIPGLQTNFYIESMKELSQKTEEPKPTVNIEGCHKHGNQQMFFFCETCSVPICHNCTVLDHKESAGHSIVSIGEAEVAYRCTLEDQLHAIHTSQTQIQRAIQHIESKINKIHAEKKSAIKDFESFIQFTHQQLQQCQQEATDVISQHHEAQLSKLRSKQRQLREAMKVLAKPISQSEVMETTGDIVALIDSTEKLRKATGNIRMNAVICDQIENDFTPDVLSEPNSIKKLRHIGKKCFQSFLPTTVVFKNHEIIAGLQSPITIELFNDVGNKVPFVASFLTVEIRDPEQTELKVKLITTYPECTMVFTPQTSGKHEISAMYLYKKFENSHTHISVNSNDPVLKFGCFGDGNGKLDSPRGIAIGDNNCLYVADTDNQMIQKFTADGQFLSQFCVNSRNKDSSVMDLAIDVDKGFIVCNETEIDSNGVKNTVLVFNLEGDMLDLFSCDEICSIYSLAINSHGDIIVCDGSSLFRKDKHTDVFHILGLPDVIDKPGYYMCIGGKDNIILTETDNNTVKILKPDGTHTATFRPVANGKLKQPFGVAADGENILVADSGHKCIKVFNYEGTLVSVIESINDPLLTPRGLAVTTDGFVFVADRNNHCIKKYKYRDVI